MNSGFQSTTTASVTRRAQPEGRSPAPEHSRKAEAVVDAQTSLSTAGADSASRELYRLAFSIDLEEWYHSGRWVNGPARHAVPAMTPLFQSLYGSDRPAGEVLAPTRALLDLFDRHSIKITFFVLGEMAEYYPDLVREIAERGHEIACHGMHHVDMTVLGPQQFAVQLERAVNLIERASGRRPVGYRAPNLIYEPWATPILEDFGFQYDASVCASRPLAGKYKGWADAPSHPYRPSHGNIGRPGHAKLIEVPLPSFPWIRINAGSGIMLRVIGFYWTYLALKHELRTGDTSFYFHSWEVGDLPAGRRRSFRSSVFFRRTGPWMLRAVEHIIRSFRDRIVTVCEAASRAADRQPASIDVREASS